MRANRVGTRTLVVLGTVMSLLIGAAGLAGAAGLWMTQRTIDSHGFDLAAPSATDPADTSSPVMEGTLGGACQESCNYLVLGSDSRAGLSNKEQNGFGSDAEIDGYRSDTI